MAHEIKPLSCDPKRPKGLSEKLIVSHWASNYGGAVTRLNAFAGQLASLDIATASVFVVNGLKREELIAMNSMILHELYFDSLGDGGEPDRALRDALPATSAALSGGGRSSSRWAKPWEAGPAGSCSRIRRAIACC
jgi:Fe-Mn family superoxide dismutase